MIRKEDPLSKWQADARRRICSVFVHLGLHEWLQGNAGNIRLPRRLSTENFHHAFTVLILHTVSLPSQIELLTTLPCLSIRSSVTFTAASERFSRWAIASAVDGPFSKSLSIAVSSVIASS